MAYPVSRSMNQELSEGMTDGKYKKIRPDTSVVVNDETPTNRAELDDIWFGIHEKQVKVAPDGLLHATPEYLRNAIVNLDQV